MAIIKRLPWTEHKVYIQQNIDKHPELVSKKQSWDQLKKEPL
jgi:hypothetical protein